MQFSVKTLLLLTAAHAVFLAVCVAVGVSEALFCAVPATIAVFGYVAHQKDKAAPFWKTVIAGVLFVVVLPTHTGVLRNFEVVIAAIAAGFSFVLSLSAIRHGHWTTNILAIPIFLLGAFFIGAVIVEGWENWAFVDAYWRGLLCELLGTQ